LEKYVVQGTDSNVWKEIAIGKQMLLKTVTDALGIEAACSEEELEVALAEGVRQIAKAGSIVSQAKKEHQAAMDKLENKLQLTETAKEELEATNAELLADKEKLESLLEATRKTTEQDTTRLSSELEEKKKQLKSINVALADTPENVVKKLKTLNKKKFDAETAKKRVEDELKALKKIKREVAEQLKSKASQSTILADKHRELQTLCEDQFTQLKDLVEDESTLTALPELDEDLLNSLAEAA
jgi:colicin import membrane protein